MGCWGFCPPHPNPTAAVGLWPQGWDGEAQSAPLSFADSWGSRTRERVWAALCPSPHPQPGAAPERKPRSQGPPAGIPGQGRQQLTAERALGGAAGSSPGSRPSCATSEGCDQGKGSVLPAAARPGAGRGSCLERPQPQGQGDRLTCQTRERRLSDVFWGREMMPA